jgi:von Hippel-Lindau disease tumor supressor
MQLSSKHALLSIGLLSALTLTQACHAASPIEQMVNQEVDRAKQRGQERTNDDEQRRHGQHERHDERRKHGHHGHHGTNENNAHHNGNSVKSCNDERNFRSVQGSIHTSMKFINSTQQEVRAYWLDYSGRRVFYKAIPPRGHYTQPTFETHPWVVTDARDNCLNIFVSNQPSAVAEIRQ